MAARSSIPAIENSMDRGLMATVHGSKSWTELSTTYMKVPEKIR